MGGHDLHYANNPNFGSSNPGQFQVQEGEEVDE
jgi:hypothetical protein